MLRGFMRMTAVGTDPGSPGPDTGAARQWGERGEISPVHDPVGTIFGPVTIKHCKVCEQHAIKIKIWIGMLEMP